MNANAIYLAVKGYFEDKISANVKRAMNTVAASCRNASKVVGGISAAFGSLGTIAQGSLAKVAGSVGGVVQALATMGPLGGVITGISAAIELFSSKALNAAKAAEEFAKTNLARGLEKLNQVRADAIVEINRNLAETTSRADKAAKAFDTLANAYLKVARAQSETEKAGGDAALSDLRLQKQNALSNAASPESAALAGADFDVKIANRKYANVVAESAAKVKEATEEAAFAQKRASAAAELEANLKKELAAAEADIIERGDVDREFDKALQARREKAEAAYDRAVNDRVSAEANARAAAEAVKTAQLRQTESVNNATAELVAAKRTQRELVAAQKKATEEQVAAAEASAQAKAAEEKRNALRREEANQRNLIDAFKGGIPAAQAQADESARKAEEAFQRFKNPKAFRELDREERRAQRDEKRFQQQFERLQKRKDWRTADLHGGDEAVRRVALAREQAENDKKRVEVMQKDVARATADLAAIRRNIDGVAL